MLLSSHLPHKKHPSIKILLPRRQRAQVPGKFTQSLTPDINFYSTPSPSPFILKGKSLQEEGGQGWTAAPGAGAARRLQLPTWRVHFNVKYQLSGIGHHHFPPVRVIAVHIPHRVVHRDSQVPARLEIRGWIARLLIERGKNF